MLLRTVVGAATCAPAVYGGAMKLPAGLAVVLVISAMALFAYVEVRRISSRATVKLRSGSAEIETTGEVDPLRAAEALRSMRRHTEPHPEDP